MEPSDFKELFTYNHTVRQNYIDAFKKKLLWLDMIKNHETAWLSLKDTLLHIIWAEDSWINYSIQDLDPLKVLKMRFAKDKITREEYEEMQRMLLYSLFIETLFTE